MEKFIMNEDFSQTTLENIKNGRFFSFEGICSLEKYWIHFLISWAIVLLAYGYSFLYEYTPHWLNLIETIVCVIALVVCNIHLICLGVQRFRATGRNPWKMLIPIYSSIIIMLFPSCKDQSKNKYLDYTIPAEKWLRVFPIIFAIVFTNPISFSSAIHTELTGISKDNSGRVVFSTDDIICRKYHTNEGINYYFNIYRYNGSIIDTLVFSNTKTLKFLKKQYKELKKNDSEKYVDAFIDKIKDLYSCSPSIELYDAEGESIILLEPDEYIGRIDEIIEKYNPKIIRFWYEAFDSVFEEDFLTLREAYEKNINE